jgi:hypothetical protein
LTRRDRITILLDWYLDVIHGLSDYQLSSEHTRQPVLGMCRSWNSRSYRQLEELRQRMRDTEPFTYWHIAEIYFRPNYRMVMRCPYEYANGPRKGQRCDFTKPAGTTGVHTHSRRTSTLVPHLEKVVSQAICQDQVDLGIDWIDNNWRGTAVIPEDLLAVIERREPKRRNAA